MTKENQDELSESLERIVLHAKDISSYLDNINDTLTEILDCIEDYEAPHDKAYTYEINEDGEAY